MCCLVIPNPRFFAGEESLWSSILVVQHAVRKYALSQILEIVGIPLYARNDSLISPDCSPRQVRQCRDERRRVIE